MRQGWDLETRHRLPGTVEGLLWEPATQGNLRVRGGVTYVVSKYGSLHAVRLDDSA
jgi:hypothetical protein